MTALKKRLWKQIKTIILFVSAYTHAYLKLGGYFNPALTFGVSTDLNNTAYMFGFSAIFGHQSRLIGTLGIAGAKVDFLRGNYSTSKVYNVANLKGVDEAGLTEKVFKTGFFFGLSYNISKSR